MTVRDFARAVQVGAPSLSQYETDRQRPRDVQGFAERVERVTGVSAAWLLGEDEDVRHLALAG